MKLIQITYAAHSWSPVIPFENKIRNVWRNNVDMLHAHWTTHTKHVVRYTSSNQSKTSGEWLEEWKVEREENNSYVYIRHLNNKYILLIHEIRPPIQQKKKKNKKTKIESCERNLDSITEDYKTRHPKNKARTIFIQIYPNQH